MPRLEMNFPQHKPWTAIGETWERYVLPRVTQHLASDPGTTIPPADVLARNTVANLRVYAEAKAFTEKNGALFGMIYIPFPSAIGHGDETPHETITRWAAGNHVPLIDLEPRFAKEDAGRLSKDGIHPTAYSDTVIAEEIGKQWGTMEMALAGRAAPDVAAK